MLTFLELYQTLLGFVFFKLYTDAGLVYPPPLDAKKDESGAGVGAFSLQDAKREAPPKSTANGATNGKKASAKDVRQSIKSISAAAPTDGDIELPNVEETTPETEEDFIPQPSTSNPTTENTSLPTLQSLSAALPQFPLSSKLFTPYTFWLSRETSRPIFEFIVRSCGGRIGWPATSGSGSPLDESDDSITHVIIDRPVVVKENETDEERDRRQRRKYVQPQWVVDCINAGKILLEEPYGQGKMLPPHLSPFEDREDAYDPTVGLDNQNAIEEDEESEVEMGDGEEEEEEGEEEEVQPEKAALKAAALAEDAAALRAAELEAEAAGVDFGTFEKEAKKARKKETQTKAKGVDEKEEDMNKMMMSNKQRKLYERMKHGSSKRAAERRTLELKKHAIEKEKKKRARS